MRTTLTLDDDLAVILKRLADETGRPFKDVVNEAIRAGLREQPTETEIHIPQPRDLGLRMDAVEAQHLMEELDLDKQGRIVYGDAWIEVTDDRS